MNNTLPSFYSFPELFSSDIADSTPVAFEGKKEIRFGQLKQDVALLVQKLKAHQAQRVALCCKDSYLFCVGFLAMCFSHKTLILPSNYQPASINELNDEFELLLCDTEVEQQPCWEITSNPYSGNRFGSSDGEFSGLDTQAISLVLFTSGTNGVPKSIKKTLQQIEIEINALQELWGSRLANTRVISTVSHQHIYGLLFRLLWPLCSLRPFSVNNLEYPEQLLAHAGQEMVLVSSPALLRRLSLIDKREDERLSMAAVFSSGGVLPKQAANTILGLFSIHAHEVYGSTETGGIAYRQQRDENEAWRAFPNIEIRVNQKNWLEIRSPYLETNQWYQTADEIELLSADSFILKGRTDRVVKIEEKRVSLAEVENRLEQLEWIEEGVVVALQEPDRLVLGALIVLSIKGQKTLRELGKGQFWLLLRRELRQWLEPVTIPRRYRVLDVIPVNSQGKRLLKEIERQFID